jgi:asparagine synthase (glutamine-hydrolysing)
MSSKLSPDLRRTIVRGALAQRDGGAALRAIRSRMNGVRGDALAETLFLDAQLALPDDMLHYFDRASMAHSLEVRVPFLDHVLVEFCAKIPSNLKVRRLTGKYLLRRVARGVVPDFVLEKRKVGFFRDAVDIWFDRQAEGAIAEWLLAPDARYTALLDQAIVRRIVREHLAGSNRTHTNLLLAILMLEVWLASYLPRAVGGRPLAATA